MEPDVQVINNLSVVIIDPVSDEAKEWCAEHLPEDAMRWGVCGYVVEPRYANDILDGMMADGLLVA